MQTMTVLQACCAVSEGLVLVSLFFRFDKFYKANCMLAHHSRLELCVAGAYLRADSVPLFYVVVNMTVIGPSLSRMLLSASVTALKTAMIVHLREWLPVSISQVTVAKLFSFPLSSSGSSNDTCVLQASHYCVWLGLGIVDGFKFVRLFRIPADDGISRVCTSSVVTRCRCADRLLDRRKMDPFPARKELALTLLSPQQRSVSASSQFTHFSKLCLCT